MKQNTKILLLSGCLVFLALTMLTIHPVSAQDTFRIGKGGGSEMIDRHGVCKKVINNHPDYDIFVPVKTAAEWLAFRTNHPAYVELVECCECTQGSDCAAGYYCRESDCTCQAVPVCQLRVEAGYGTTNVTNNTQVAGCNGTCQACQNGACGVAGAGTDPGNQCAAAWTSCDSSCVKRGNSGNCKGGVAACATGDVTAYLSTAGKVCSGGSEVNPSSSVRCDATINCTTGWCFAARYYRGCVAGGTSCTDTGRVSYTDWNASDGNVINQTTYKVGTTCTQASPSTSIYCSTANANNNNCQYTTYYRACAGTGSCRTDNTYAASAQTTCGANQATKGQTSCATVTTGNYCQALTNACNGACQKRTNYYGCAASGSTCEATSRVTSDSYLATAGRVCSGGSEVNPSSSVRCDATINCTTGWCFAARYYRGCVAGGTSCTDTNRQSYTTWNSSNNYTINQTTYKVGTSCTTAYTSCGGSICTKCDGGGNCWAQSSSEDLYNQCAASGGCSVVVNSHSGGTTCNTKCSAQSVTSGYCNGSGACGGAKSCTCVDVGTDTAATNNNYWAQPVSGEPCKEIIGKATCATPMTNDMTTLCNGYATKWTRCKCQ